MEENNNEKVRKGNVEQPEVKEETIQVETQVEEIKEEPKQVEKPKNIKVVAKTNKEIKSKNKKKLNKQTILLIVIIVACLVITVGLIILKIRELNEEYKYVEKSDEVFMNEDKVEDPDGVLAVDKNTTYNLNDLIYTEWYDIGGEIKDKRDYTIEAASKDFHSFIQISGLKDKNIENKINTELKNFVYENAGTDPDGKIYCQSYVTGNFSNILSVAVNTYHGEAAVFYGFNYDLNTGEQIPFENIFTKSTPINALLAESAMQVAAWNIEDGVIVSSGSGESYYEQLQEYYNMDNRDTSEYEDMLLKVSKKYNELKGNVQYNVTPYGITIYNLMPDEFADNDVRNTRFRMKISMYKYPQYIAIYKRYSGTDIFEKSDIGLKNIRAFYMPMSYYTMNTRKNTAKDTIYGDLSDNVFCDIALTSYMADYNESLQKAVELAKVNITNKVNEIKNNASQDSENGYVIQGTINPSYSDGSYIDYETQKYLIPHITVRVRMPVTKFPKDKYENLNYYLGWLTSLPTASADPHTFNEYWAEDIGVTTTIEEMTMYYDKDGNYLGTDKSVLIDEERNYNPS